MTKIAIVYHSATGTTKTLAQSIKAGAISIEGVEVVEVELLGKDIIEGRYIREANLEILNDVSGIIFGSPTFMGSVSAQFKAFADASGDLWSRQEWSGKVASGFTVGSNICGDQLHTIQYMQVFASQHGMIWASLDIPGGQNEGNLNRLGAQSGLIAYSISGEVEEVDMLTAQYLGSRVSKLAQILARSNQKL